MIGKRVWAGPAGVPIRVRCLATAVGVIACLGAAAAATAQQRNPTAHCNDGTYYYGASRHLACAHHRGVSEWLARPQAGTHLRHSTAISHRKPPAAARAGSRPHGAPAAATARCRDGSWSTQSRRASACARHGGIARWLGRR